MDNPSLTKPIVSHEMQEDYMPGKVVNHVPRLLKERNLSVPDLMFGARLAAGTAYSWADEENPPKRIDLPTLARICDFMKVGVEDILEYIPD